MSARRPKGRGRRPTQPRRSAPPARPTGDPELGALLRDVAVSDQAPDRYTHGIHPWPARFDWRLPAAAIARRRARQPDAPCVVLDPFAGSGTTLVEAVAAGCSALGSDLNPVAALLGTVKATALDAAALHALEAQRARLVKTSLARSRHGHRASQAAPLPPAARPWFAPHVYWELAGLRELIDATRPEALRDPLRVALSSIVVRVSHQRRDSQSRHRERSLPRGRSTQFFGERVKALATGLRALAKRAPDSTPAPEIRCGDARALDWIDPDSVDLCVTSPPYANVYDYADFHRFRGLWLQMDWGGFERGEIGARRNFEQGEGAALLRRWQQESEAWLAELARVLVPGGEAWVVIGDSVLGNRAVDGARLIREAGERVGLSLEAAASIPRPNFHAGHAAAFKRRPKQEHLLRLIKKDRAGA